MKFVECQVNEVTRPSFESGLTYEIGSAAIDVSFDEFKSTDADNCKLTPWTYTANLVEASIDGAQMSSYITLDAATQMFKIYAPSGVA